MDSKLKADYPRRINGSITCSADDKLGVPELELTFELGIDSKGDRKVVSVGARIPSRFAGFPVKPIFFEQSKCIVDYNSRDEVYAVMLSSIDAFINPETKTPIFDSEIEKYCRLTEDVSLMILINACQFLWTGLLDNIDIINMSGQFIKAVLKNFQEGISDLDEGVD